MPKMTRPIRARMKMNMASAAKVSCLVEVCLTAIFELLYNIYNYMCPRQ